MHITHWTGRDAAALQSALRLTNETFAERLGIAVRTVAGWHAKPQLQPRMEMQQLLDELLTRLSPAELERFHERPLTEAGRGATSSDSEALRAAIAIVAGEKGVLVVCRRADTAVAVHWQFPAGIIKPGASAERIAERETLAETGVHCAAVRTLGSRIHPVTRVHCCYVLCEYLAGDPENLDPVENADVLWAPIDRLSKFIPLTAIYPPVMAALRGSEV